MDALSIVHGDVRDFHERFGLLINGSPTRANNRVRALRKELIREEALETMDAIEMMEQAHTPDQVLKALAEFADGACDLIYVLIGAATSFGIDLSPVWDAVQKANMSKEGGKTREDGKILKPSGWIAPDVAHIITEQLASGRSVL